MQIPQEDEVWRDKSGAGVCVVSADLDGVDFLRLCQVEVTSMSLADFLRAYRRITVRLDAG